MPITRPRADTSHESAPRANDEHGPLGHDRHSQRVRERAVELGGDDRGKLLDEVLQPVGVHLQQTRTTSRLSARSTWRDGAGAPLT